MNIMFSEKKKKKKKETRKVSIRPRDKHFAKTEM